MTDNGSETDYVRMVAEAISAISSGTISSVTARDVEKYLHNKKNEAETALSAHKIGKQILPSLEKEGIIYKMETGRSRRHRFEINKTNLANYLKSSSQ